MSEVDYVRGRLHVFAADLERTLGVPGWMAETLVMLPLDIEVRLRAERIMDIVDEVRERRVGGAHPGGSSVLSLPAGVSG